jgi:acetyltransferase-like isoleucine patch superfamily enzyme
MSIIKTIKFRIANRSSAGRVKYLCEQGCKIGVNTRLLCEIGSFGTEPYLIEIGDDCLISNNISFFTHDGGVKVLNSLGYWGDKRMDKIGKIVIGNNCFIGNSAKIMSGITVGDNVIIGAGAIVTKDIPSGVVAVGNPCKVLREIGEYDKEYYFKDCKIDYNSI